MICHQELKPYDGFNSDPLFNSQITQEPLSRHFQFPQLESHDGMTDPANHLESFKVVMLLQGALDAILCRVFPSTLKGAMRYWYSNLKPASFHSFDQLSQSFISHFISS